MNAVKVAYIVCALIGDIFFFGVAIAAPIWITPEYYWWTALALLFFCSSSHAFTERLNKWGL